MTRLKDKVAVVTGGSRGIGEAIACGFAREGAKVVISSRKMEGLETAAEKIRSAGGEVLPVTCHMGQPGQIPALFDAAESAYGQVDVLVNNAATNPYFGPLESTEEWAWDKTFDVNVKGYFGACREFSARVKKRNGKGSVIQVTSVLGQMASPMQGVYGMTKAAVISMTRTLAYELGTSGVRVNAIAPGLIETKFSKALVENEALREMVLARTALKRVGQPDDLIGPALFLASEEAAYVTGTVLVVDGGWSMS